MLLLQGYYRRVGEGWRYIRRYKQLAEEWEDKVKKKEEVVEKLEKKREQYEGES